MAVLESHINRASPEFQENHAHFEGLVAELRARVELVRQGGGEAAIAKHRARDKLLPRERIERLCRSRHAVPRIQPARRVGDVRRRRARRRHRHRHRRRRGAGVRDRRQRRHRQGRHLLPDDGQEASARAGDRRAEPPAVHLSRRFRRRVPAAAGRGLSRPRALRAHLLQPGAHVRARASRRSPP